MKRKILASILAGLVTISSLTACDNKSNSGDGDEIVIGAVGPHTKDLSVYGIPVKNGIEMAVKEINENGGINGKKIRLAIEDNQSSDSEVVNAYNKLKDTEKVVAIIGDVTSGNSSIVAARANADKIPMLTPSATDASVTQTGEYIFRACFTDPVQGEIVANYSVEKLGAKTAAVLYNADDSYSRGLFEGFKAAAEELNLEIIAEETYNNKAVDFNSQLTNIKNANPDILFVPVYAEDAALIVNQAKSVGVTSTLVGGDGWDGILSKMNGGEDALANSYFFSGFSTVSTDEKVQKFVSDYKAAYDSDPASFAALAYDATYMMAEAIKNAGSTDGAKIIEELKKLEYDGITGTTKFGEDRNPIKAIMVSSFEGANYKYIENYEVD
ncbi:MAG: ABC transporter substrate-binding protein [Clostridiales bacterium]|nr:ABC transporter substrate-binding protein [Clostridiales bacterium]